MNTETWDFEDHRLAIHTAGSGPLLLLFHGIGPGTSIAANFSAVTDELAKHYTLVGTDMIGFGGSSRKTEDPYFDFALWCRQADFVAARVREAHGWTSLRIWGHSLGGAIAPKLAAGNRDVTHVVATGTGGGNHRVNPPLDRFWTIPRSREQLREAMLGSMLNPADVTDALVDQRWATLMQGDIGSYFGRMMSGDKQALLDSVHLAPSLLARIAAQVLLVHGRDDQPVPYRDNALPLLECIAHCDAVLLGNCGHNPAREMPAKTLQLVLAHLAQQA